MLLLWKVISILLGPFQSLSVLILISYVYSQETASPCSFSVIPLSINVIFIKNYATNLFTQTGDR